MSLIQQLYIISATVRKETQGNNLEITVPVTLNLSGVKDAGTFNFPVTAKALKFGCPLPMTILLPERDHVTFGSLLSQIRLSVTFMHPTQGVEAFFFTAVFLATF